MACYESLFHNYPEGTTGKTFGNEPATHLYDQFKNVVGAALTNYLGAGAVMTRGDKAFDIKEPKLHTIIATKACSQIEPDRTRK